MTATQKFIEDAIKGGWGNNEYRNYHRNQPELSSVQIEKRTEFPHEYLFDPRAWQAVARTRKWLDMSSDGVMFYGLGIGDAQQRVDQWKWSMLQFMDQIGNGKTIDEALQVSAPTPGNPARMR